MPVFGIVFVERQVGLTSTLLMIDIFIQSHTGQFNELSETGSAPWTLENISTPGGGTLCCDVWSPLGWVQGVGVANS